VLLSGFLLHLIISSLSRQDQIRAASFVRGLAATFESPTTTPLVDPRPPYLHH
jgi:hypothetical protein